MPVPPQPPKHGSCSDLGVRPDPVHSQGSTVLLNMVRRKARHAVAHFVTRWQLPAQLMRSAAAHPHNIGCFMRLHHDLGAGCDLNKVINGHASSFLPIKIGLARAPLLRFGKAGWGTVCGSTIPKVLTRGLGRE